MPRSHVSQRGAARSSTPRMAGAWTDTTMNLPGHGRRQGYLGLDRSDRLIDLGRHPIMVAVAARARNALSWHRDLPQLSRQKLARRRPRLPVGLGVVFKLVAEDHEARRLQDRRIEA